MPPIHPVIIVGAGPCGLVAALTLKKADVPFVIYERASASKVCSNAGSGFDMAPTALKILEDELGLSGGLDKAMQKYEYMQVSDMDGKHVKTFRLQEMNKKLGGRGFGFASRSIMQHVLLDALGVTDEDGNIVEGGILHCGITVTGYEHKGRNADGTYELVNVQLDNGTTVDGSALFACDGIHSRVRKCMFKDVDDSMNYCGQEVWWGKTRVEPDSSIYQELKRIQQERNMDDGNVSYMVMGTKRNPHIFFTCEVSENLHNWIFAKDNKKAPRASANANDSTRRGGKIIDEEKHRELADLISKNGNEVVKLFINETPPEDITYSGFFDRSNQKLRYVDGLVALLGDAAHPQSPMMGQGANMAIVDGYVAATRLIATVKKNEDSESRHIQQALVDFDSKIRRKQNSAVVLKARKYGAWCVSKNRFTIWAMQTATKYMPPSALIKELTSGDKSNKLFLDAMKRDLEK